MNVTNVGVGKLDTKSWKVSASQVKKWMECPRSWGYAYIEDMKTPPGAGAILGSDVHAELEHHFKGTRQIDTNTRAGKIAKSGLHLLPDVGAHGLVEPPIHFSVDGVNYRGFVDLTWDENGKVISDHKTSKNPKKYGLVGEQLLTDPQGLIYGLWGLEHFKLKMVRLQWTYLPTAKGKPYAIRTELRPNQARNNFMRIIQPIGLAIVEAVKTLEEAKTLEAKPESCGLYGGCPHAAYCPRTTSEKLDALFSGEKESKHVGLKDLIKNKKKSPPRPEELSNVVDMPGQRINSPEAPKTPEIARAISRSADLKSAAAAAAGADTVEEAEQSIKDAEPVITVGEPKDWDPTVTPSQDQVLAWVCSETFTEFIPDRKTATKEMPFAHGRSLGSMGRAGLIEHKREGTTYKVEPTAKGIAKYKTIADGDIWVAPGVVPAVVDNTETVGSGTNPPIGTRAALSEGETPTDREQPQSRKQLVVVYRNVDGVISIDIDPKAFA